MSEIIDKLVMYFGFDFVKYAVIVGILVAFCSSLLGVTLVLKRLSFIGSGLSHVTFGATTSIAAITAALGFNNNIFFVLPITIGCAILLLCTGKNSKIKGDSALAMISVGSIAIGYLISYRFPTSPNRAGDICEVLFGSTAILSLSEATVWLCIGLSILVAAVFFMLYHKIFAITFDEDFAAATGTKAKIYNLLLAVVIAVIIVLAMNLVGALLVSALVVFPAMTAMRVFKSFKAVTICSVIVSVTCAAIGLLASILLDNIPVGSAIVAVYIAIFGVFSVIGLILRR
jgi:zinc transport system permease protein